MSNDRPYWYYEERTLTSEPENYEREQFSRQSGPAATSISRAVTINDISFPSPATGHFYAYQRGFTSPPNAQIGFPIPDTPSAASHPWPSSQYQTPPVTPPVSQNRHKGFVDDISKRDTCDVTQIIAETVRRASLKIKTTIRPNTGASQQAIPSPPFPQPSIQADTSPVAQQ
ncbi:hypothetical protein FRB94_013284 [Tulasnella sp. JGI-2019a]|nr:hypothetical protein FRB93_007959 [Tulasnella sp. JGI-2019a]KAG8990579.1 hypothetical protein FRB94_013284 [Tulasnella sp. JGI-2019a]KAG9030824.1 hypothetical protein FRB95_003516 [Tulasnella sp. JGI-2019a]